MNVFNMVLKHFFCRMIYFLTGATALIIFFLRFEMVGFATVNRGVSLSKTSQMANQLLQPDSDTIISIYIFTSKSQVTSNSRENRIVSTSTRN